MLYGIVVVCGMGVVALWAVSNRARRNAGFATKAQLKRHLSANAVVKAAEIRPSLSNGDGAPSRPATAALTKHGRSRA
ncbi:hypothetical protein [Streptomyces sp. UNOC14_S4]|uniref:hypothetical protein n=1 Tax=Streptomyces sp. UNOC14_S4 TaxID=2872340 RepID=UPI001E499182|nr:hypothetical protein [Streptomyces sp. UNOC14_S4]MCC3767567.1 hypothetical protein [Streptomyces sp. UNOC14_S4]